MGVEIPITVPPSLPLTVSAEEAAPFVGDYTFTWVDSTATEKPSRFTVERRGMQLFGVWDTPQFGSMREMQLLAHGPDTFAYGFVRNGELWSTNMRMTIRIQRRNGRITGFEYGSGPELFARGVRR